MHHSRIFRLLRRGKIICFVILRFVALRQSPLDGIYSSLLHLHFQYPVPPRSGDYGVVVDVAITENPLNSDTTIGTKLMRMWEEFIRQSQTDDVRMIRAACADNDNV